MVHEIYRKIGTPSMRIIEECGEIIKATMKCERFGCYNWNPADEKKKKNIENLRDEVVDLVEAFKDFVYENEGNKDENNN